jgi:hypothetical protein
MHNTIALWHLFIQEELVTPVHLEREWQEQRDYSGPLVIAHSITCGCLLAKLMKELLQGSRWHVHTSNPPSGLSGKHWHMKTHPKDTHQPHGAIPQSK